MCDCVWTIFFTGASHGHEQESFSCHSGDRRCLLVFSWRGCGCVPILLVGARLCLELVYHQASGGFRMLLSRPNVRCQCYLPYFRGHWGPFAIARFSSVMGPSHKTHDYNSCSMQPLQYSVDQFSDVSWHVQCPFLLVLEQILHEVAQPSSWP